jgi:hypothetical protein
VRVHEHASGDGSRCMRVAVAVRGCRSSDRSYQYPADWVPPHTGFKSKQEAGLLALIKCQIYAPTC